MSNIYYNPINQPVTEEPKKSSKKIILFVVLGLVVIIGIVYLRGSSLIKESAKSNIDQVQFTVDFTCAMYHAIAETSSWNTVDFSNITFDQISSKYPGFYQVLEPKLQPIMQKYNLSIIRLGEEREKSQILMHTDSSFKKKVTDVYLKSRCK